MLTLIQGFKELYIHKSLLEAGFKHLHHKIPQNQVFNELA